MSKAVNIKIPHYFEDYKDSFGTAINDLAADSCVVYEDTRGDELGRLLKDRLIEPIKTTVQYRTVGRMRYRYDEIVGDSVLAKDYSYSNKYERDKS